MMKILLECVTIALLILLASCSRGERTKSEKNVPDSAINDSVPASGENEYQNDLEPKNEIDSIPDSTGRKP